MHACKVVAVEEALLQAAHAEGQRARGAHQGGNERNPVCGDIQLGSTGHCGNAGSESGLKNTKEMCDIHK